jgi:steroid delta-isomerase-like uncharacterized protein
MVSIIMSTTSPERVTEILHTLVEGWNNNDVHAVVGLYAKDFIEEDIGLATPTRGVETIRLIMRIYRRAFPDLHIEADDLVIQGDCAAFSWILTGTHRGTIMNIPPTGRRVRLRGISMIHFENGFVVRAVRVWDLAGMLRTFGLLPELH